MTMTTLFSTLTTRLCFIWPNPPPRFNEYSPVNRTESWRNWNELLNPVPFTWVLPPLLACLDLPWWISPSVLPTFHHLRLSFLNWRRLGMTTKVRHLMIKTIVGRWVERTWSGGSIGTRRPTLGERWGLHFVVAWLDLWTIAILIPTRLMLTGKWKLKVPSWQRRPKRVVEVVVVDRHISPTKYTKRKWLRIFWNNPFSGVLHKKWQTQPSPSYVIRANSRLGLLSMMGNDRPSSFDPIESNRGHWVVNIARSSFSRVAGMLANKVLSDREELQPTTTQARRVATKPLIAFPQ